MSAETRGDAATPMNGRRIAIVVAIVISVGLATWGVIAAFGSDSDSDTGQAASSSSPATQQSAVIDASSGEGSSASPPASGAVTLPPETSEAVSPPAATGSEPSAGPDTGSETVSLGDPDARPRTTEAPVAITETASASEKLQVRVVSIEPVQGEVVLPGEVAGPALRITIEASNGSSEDLATPAVVANLYYGPNQLPAGALLQPGSRQFPASIPAGETASGVFVFSVPEDQRDNVRVEVDLAIDEPVVLFEGAVS